MVLAIIGVGVQPVLASGYIFLAATPVSHSSIELRWGVADLRTVDDYQIKYSGDNGKSWTVFNDGVGTYRNTLVTGLVPGTIYYFNVQPIVNGTVSDNIGTASTYTMTEAPTNIQAALNSLTSTLAVTWDFPVNSPHNRDFRLIMNTTDANGVTHLYEKQTATQSITLDVSGFNGTDVVNFDVYGTITGGLLYGEPTHFSKLFSALQNVTAP